MPNLPTFTDSVSLSIQQFANADGTNLKVIQNTTTNGIRITAIDVSNSDADLEFELQINDGSTDYEFWTGQVPQDSGRNDGIPLYSVLKQESFKSRQLDANSNPYIDLPATHSIKMKMNTAVSGAELVNVFVWGETF